MGRKEAASAEKAKGRQSEMKACVIQPPYGSDSSRNDEFIAFTLQQLEECEEDLDIVVLPEYCELPCVAKTEEETLLYHEKYFGALMAKCRETALRCHAMVFFNALSREADGWRNTTYCLNRKGELAGKYFKTHIPIGEMRKNVAYAYTEEPVEPYVLKMEGLRFAFLTCYDFYFYEGYARLAQAKPDVIIGCSHQRSDTHDAIEILCRFLAYHTNAYVLRSSVSFDENATVCGASMIVSPTGDVLCNLKGKFGRGVAEFDPNKKYWKAAGFGNPPAPHYEYIDAGRNPWLYRNSGPSVVPTDKTMAYPRLCAHRGLHAIAPENSLPAFGAAVAMDAREIEFDLWTSSDGVLVSCHDSTLERVSNGTGKIYEKTFEELRVLDFGKDYENGLGGLEIPTFEEILRKFAGRVIMNIHVKIWDKIFEDPKIEEILRLVRKYDAVDYVYFMSSNAEILSRVKQTAPEFHLCLGKGKRESGKEMVEDAIRIGADKVQLFKPYFTKEDIELAHANGIRCNVFWSNDAVEAKEFLEMGIDTVLTDDYHTVSRATGIK